MYVGVPTYVHTYLIRRGRNDVLYGRYDRTLVGTGTRAMPCLRRGCRWVATLTFFPNTISPKKAFYPISSTLVFMLFARQAIKSLYHHY